MVPAFETLVACASCSEHVRADDATCPHCGSAMPRKGGLRQKTAAAVVMGLVAAMVPVGILAGCGGDEGSGTTSGGGDGTGGTGGTSTTTTTGTTGDGGKGGASTTTSTTSTTSTGLEAVSAYGVGASGPGGFGGAAVSTGSDAGGAYGAGPSTGGGAQ